MPLPEQLIPAVFVSLHPHETTPSAEQPTERDQIAASARWVATHGDRLKSLTLELASVCTYDAAMVSTASGSEGGQ